MRILLPLFLACAAFAADSDGPACPANSKPFAPSNSDWNGWGLDATNTRFQARPGLAAKDVPKLKVKWAFAFQGDVRTVSQPTVMGGRVFVSSWGGKVYSLDAATGCTYWLYDAQSIARTAIQIVKDPQTNRYVAFFGSHPWAHAVDAETGKVLWKVRVDDHKEGRVTGAPMYYNGRVIVPVASGDTDAWEEALRLILTDDGHHAALVAAACRAY